MHWRSVRVLLALTTSLAVVSTASATTSYFVRLRPAGTVGLHAAYAFDFTHADTLARNRATFLSFAHDGKADSAIVEGGPGYGDLIRAANPAVSTTLENQYFYNTISVPFDSLGSFAQVRLNLTEEGPSAESAPDEFSMYFIRRSTGLAYPTDDDLEANALFVVDITGAAGGDLTVFSPMVFIAPDTIALDGGVLDAAKREPLQGRVRFTGLTPNPAVKSLRIEYYVPQPGGWLSLTVLDVSGRRVANILRMRSLPGPASVSWDVRGGNGSRLSPGIYFLRLELASQTAVRRVVLAK